MTSAPTCAAADKLIRIATSLEEFGRVVPPIPIISGFDFMVTYGKL
jgi:hypothetical protein